MMRLFTLYACILLSRFASAKRFTSAGRQVASASSDLIKCVLDGPDGTSVMFPVAADKCNTQCVRVVEWHGRARNQEDMQFPVAFNVKYSTFKNKCVCSVDGEDKVQFEPIACTAGVCKEQCEADANDAKVQCWESYKRTAAMIPETKIGNKTIYRRGKKFAHSSDFEIKQDCSPCEGTACHEFSLPSVIASLTKEEMAAMFEEIERQKQAGKLKGDLKEFDDMLVENDRAKMLFARIDKDGDGVLSISELEAEYPDVPKAKLQRIFRKVDVDLNNQVDFEEFLHFQVVLLSQWQIETVSEDLGNFNLRCVRTDTGENGDCLSTMKEALAQASDCLDA